MENKIFVADILSHTINGKSSGHYFAVARNYKEMLGDNVIVAGGPVYDDSFKNAELLHLPYNSCTGLKGRLHTFANARKLFRAATGQIIVMQQCTVITTFLCIILFYRHNSKLYLIQYSPEGLRSRAGRIIYRLAKRKIDGFICPNDTVGLTYQRPYCVIPDYVYTGIKSPEEAVPYENKKYDFCIIGRIAPGKGCVEAARKLANTKYKVLIAGRPQDEILEQEIKTVCKGAANIDLRLTFVSENDYRRFLDESRYTILNYQGEYSVRSSGVVYDTIFAGVPVVGCRCSALQFIDDCGIGYIYDSIDKFNPVDVMDKELYSKYLSSISKYRDTHGNYIKKLKKFLSE